MSAAALADRRCRAAGLSAEALESWFVGAGLAELRDGMLYATARALALRSVLLAR